MKPAVHIRVSTYPGSPDYGQTYGHTACLRPGGSISEHHYEQAVRGVPAIVGHIASLPMCPVCVHNCEERNRESFQLYRERGYTK